MNTKVITAADLEAEGTHYGSASREAPMGNSRHSQIVAIMDNMLNEIDDTLIDGDLSDDVIVERIKRIMWGDM